jgi:hypothetical protein
VPLLAAARDALGLSLTFAVALAAFLELALISSAVHELIGPLDPATGQRGWQHDSLSLLSAGVRMEQA